MKEKLLKLWRAVKLTITEFLDADPFLYSASISFYTLFSLPPVLFVMVQIAGYFWGDEAVSQELFNQINNVVGNKAATTIQELLANVDTESSGVWGTILSIVLLLIATTTVFISIQKGLNSVWGIKTAPENQIIKMLVDRLRSFTTVVALGFLMIVSLITDTILLLVMDNLKQVFPEITIYFAQIINWLLSLTLSALLFTYLFVVLPDTKIKWKYGFYGGVITAGLFFIGRYFISLYISTSTMDTTYGAAGSLVLILLWVYYSSLILLLGGKITEMHIRKKIK